MKELLIDWWSEIDTTKMPIPTIYIYEIEVDGKTITIESMSRSRMYVHYKAWKMYPITSTFGLLVKQDNTD